MNFLKGFKNMSGFHLVVIPTFINKFGHYSDNHKKKL